MVEGSLLSCQLKNSQLRRTGNSENLKKVLVFFWNLIQSLLNKNRNDFIPNLDLGNYVVLVNAKHIFFTGNKLDSKKYRNHSGYPGGLRERTLREMLEKYPQELVFRIIRGMMPHTKLGDKQASRLFIFAEEEMIDRNKKKILQAQVKSFIKLK